MTALPKKKSVFGKAFIPLLSLLFCCVTPCSNMPQELGGISQLLLVSHPHLWGHSHCPHHPPHQGSTWDSALEPIHHSIPGQQGTGNVITQQWVDGLGGFYAEEIQVHSLYNCQHHLTDMQQGEIQLIWCLFFFNILLKQSSSIMRLLHFIS